MKTLHSHNNVFHFYVLEFRFLFCVLQFSKFRFIYFALLAFIINLKSFFLLFVTNVSFVSHDKRVFGWRGRVY